MKSSALRTDAAAVRGADWISADEFIGASNEGSGEESSGHDCTRSRLNWEFKQEHSLPLRSFLASCSYTSPAQSVPHSTPSLDSSSSIGSPSGSSTTFSPFLTLSSFSPRDITRDIYDESISDSALWPSFEYGGEDCCPFGSPFELHMKQLPDDDPVQHRASRGAFIAPHLLQKRFSSLSANSIESSSPPRPSRSSPAPASTPPPTIIVPGTTDVTESTVLPVPTPALAAPQIHSSPQTEARLTIDHSDSLETKQDVASSFAVTSPLLVTKRQRSPSLCGSDVLPTKKSCVGSSKVTTEGDSQLTLRLTHERPKRQCRRDKSYVIEDEKDVDSGDDEYTYSGVDEDEPRPRRVSTSSTKGSKVSRRKSGSPKESKLFFCKVAGCDRSFTRQHDVRRHVKLIHEGNRLQCPYCSTSWLSRADGLRRHILSTHPRIQGSARENAIRQAVEAAQSRGSEPSA